MQKMRMQLFEVVIERASGGITAHVVAENEQRAVEIVFDHDVAPGEEQMRFTIERVDEILPQDWRKGLDEMLESAPVGFASFSKSIGWVVHVAALQKLRFFRIEDKEGVETFVIAPSRDIASALYAFNDTLDGGGDKLFRIFDGFVDLPAERICNLPALLEFGPIGIAEYHDENAWSVK